MGVEALAKSQIPNPKSQLVDMAKRETAKGTKRKASNTGKARRAATRWMLVAAVTIVCWSICGVSSAAERHWQTGTWGDVGLKRDPRVRGGAVGRSPFGTTPETPKRSVTPEVGTYVIETAELRLELEDISSISDSRRFDATVKAGDSVMFAIEKSTVHVRSSDGTDHRLRLIKKVQKKNPRRISGTHEDRLEKGSAFPCRDALKMTEAFKKRLKRRKNALTRRKNALTR